MTHVRPAQRPSTHAAVWAFYGFQIIMFSLMTGASLLIPDIPIDVRVQLQRSVRRFQLSFRPSGRFLLFCLTPLVVSHLIFRLRLPYDLVAYACSQSQEHLVAKCVNREPDDMIHDQEIKKRLMEQGTDILPPSTPATICHIFSLALHPCTRARHHASSGRCSPRRGPPLSLSILHPPLPHTCSPEYHLVIWFFPLLGILTEDLDFGFDIPDDGLGLGQSARVASGLFVGAAGMGIGAGLNGLNQGASIASGGLDKVGAGSAVDVAKGGLGAATGTFASFGFGKGSPRASDNLGTSI